MNQAITIADAHARKQALDPSQSFIVSAPAGSGKTGLLTQRVLTLLAYCEHPEEVLAITFTRKAAQEMRQRIILALRNAKKKIEPNNPNDQLTYSLAQKVLERDQEKNWQLLISPNRLRIQTIDGFCQSLVRQLPFNSGMSSMLSPTDNADSLYQQTVRQFFTAFKADTNTQNDLAVLLKHVDNDMGKLEKLLIALLNNRNQWLGLLYETKKKSDGHNFLTNSLNAVVAESLIKIRDLLGPWLAELSELGHYAAANAISENKDTLIKELIDFEYSFDSNDIDTSQIDKWKAITTLLTTQKNIWRKSITAADGFPAAEKNKDDIKKLNKSRLFEIIGELKEYPEILTQIEDVKFLPSPNIQTKQWALLDSLTRLLPRLVAEFKLLCEQTTECDFNELTQAALLALGDNDEPSDIALKLDYKINHILVDEFQDTALPQLHLLEKLTTSWQPDDGKTLFVVGDAMQSCYSFREANVGIFLGVKDNGVGNIALTPLELTVNFRSNGNIVEWVNHHFREAFPEENNINRGAISYQNADYFFPPDKKSIINIAGLIDASKEDEANYVCEKIKIHLESSDTGSIAILVRAKTHLPEILNRLRTENIVWQSKDVDKLASRMAVIDLLSLTKALVDFSDRIAWLSILRAPWCGLNMNDLFIVANSAISPLVWGCINQLEALPISEEGKQCLTRLRKILRPCIEQRHRKPLRQWIEGIWLALGGPAAVMNPTERHSPARFFELLEQHSGSNSNVNDWTLFDSAIEKLYDRTEEQSRIQVMTIHKSKGLEFDTVILPCLDRQGRSDDNALLLWQDIIDSNGHPHLLMSPLGSTGEEDPFYNYLKREKNLRQQYENARLLYIGCTRAINHLYLVGRLKIDKKTESIKEPSKNTLFSHIWGSIHDEINIIEYSENPEHENLNDENESERDENNFLTVKRLSNLLRLNTQWLPSPFPSDSSLDNYRQEFNYKNAHDDINDKNVPNANNLNNREQRYIGTVLHQALHHIIQNGSAIWDEKRIEQQKTFWANLLRQQGLDLIQASKGAEKISTAIEKIVADKDGQWILDSSHEQSESELSLMDPNAGFRESIIDRTFISDGTRWIVDFKSSEPGDNQTLEEFLAREAQAYQVQMERYVNVMRKIDSSIPIKAGLYFPFIPLLHPLDFSTTSAH